MLKPLKTKDDSAMPTKKADLYNRYISLQTRRPRLVEDVGEEETPLEEDVALLLPADDGNEQAEDCIEAMLLLNGSSNEREIHFRTV